MILLFLKFLVGHLIGDFILQPSRWVAAKIQNQEKSPELYYHIAIHILLLLAITLFNPAYYIAILTIALLHFVTDIAKIKLTGRADDTLLFLLDQIIHVYVLFAITYIIHPIKINVEVIITNKVLLLTAILLMVTFASSQLIRIAIERWRTDDVSLSQAGKYIGMGERLFVFFFMVTNHWEGIGFMLAAKSIFRFGDLNQNNDRKLTEYVLLGTLLSFGMALILGKLYQFLLSII